MKIRVCLIIPVPCLQSKISYFIGKRLRGQLQLREVIVNLENIE